MEMFSAIALVLFSLSAATLAICLRRLVVAQRALVAAGARRDRIVAAQAAGARLAQVSAAELREVSLRLLGLAEGVRRDPNSASPLAAAIVAATSQVLGVADGLHDAGCPEPRPRVLSEEPLEVGELLQGAIAAVAANLEPGRRNWRVAPEVAELTLVADRRALAHVLLRVLSNAARFTHDGDWIDVAVERRGDASTLVIADEGAGAAALGGEIGAAHPIAAANDTRGVGLGLSLARALMELHGGELIVDATARVGTRVCLTFPAQRVLPPEAHALPAHAEPAHAESGQTEPTPTEQIPAEQLQTECLVPA